MCGDQRIEVVAAAVGERDDQMSFQESATSGAQSQLSPAGTGGVQYDVDVVSLDTWTARSGARPQIMKIDVEGWEPAVIRGARRTLETFRPVLVCEVLSRTAGRDVMSALPAFYRYFQIDELGALRQFPVVERRQRRNRNWLLVPEDRVASVLQRIQ